MGKKSRNIWPETHKHRLSYFHRVWGIFPGRAQQQNWVQWWREWVRLSCLFVLQGRASQESINTLEPLWLGLGARDQLVCSREFELGSKWLSGPPFPEVETSRQQLRSSAGQPGAPADNAFHMARSFHRAFFFFFINAVDTPICHLLVVQDVLLFNTGHRTGNSIRRGLWHIQLGAQGYRIPGLETTLRHHSNHLPVSSIPTDLEVSLISFPLPKYRSDFTFSDCQSQLSSGNNRRSPPYAF